MGSKNIIWAEAKDAEVRDVAALGEAVGRLVNFDPGELRSTRNLDTFVRPFGTGQVEFYQGAAGEDSGDYYEQGLRVYSGPKGFAEVFARHLAAGRVMLRYAPQGWPPECWLAEPGKATRLDVL